LSGRSQSDAPARVETVYDEERARLKIILVGSMETNAAYFKAIKVVLESET